MELPVGSTLRLGESSRLICFTGPDELLPQEETTYVWPQPQPCLACLTISIHASFATSAALEELRARSEARQRRKQLERMQREAALKKAKAAEEEEGASFATRDTTAVDH